MAIGIALSKLTGHKKAGSTSFDDAASLILEIKSINHQMWIGPHPIHEVVVRAVRNAVRAATIIFTEISIKRLFFIVQFVLN